MKHKTLSLYVPCLEGGYEDAGRVDLVGHTLISDERLYDLEAAEKDAIEQARLNGIGAERELALMAKLEAAEKTNREWLRANAPGGWIDNLRIENTALRAKIAEMEKQEPIWFIDERGEPKRYHKSKADYCKYGGLDLLYTLPGAKGEAK